MQVFKIYQPTAINQQPIMMYLWCFTLFEGAHQDNQKNKTNLLIMSSPNYFIVLSKSGPGTSFKSSQ